MLFKITPVPSPRMTRQDVWKKRPCVMRYRAFKDECRLNGVNIESGDHITFIIPIPASKGKKKKAEMDGKPHMIRPDVDNLCKAILDAIHKEDSHIHDLRITKIWGLEGGILIKPMMESFLCEGIVK